MCIEGTYNVNPDKATIQQANLDILTPFKTCSGTVGSDIYCGGSAVLYSTGRVCVTNDEYHCSVSAYGAFNCYQDME